MASKSINRTVAVAWAPSSQYSSLLATGTLAGALDDTFSTTAELEIHDLMLGDRHSINANCKATISSPARFNRLVWSQLSNVSSEGILAGGLEDGSICLWNVRNILEGNTSESLIYRKECHTGPVKALQFNPFNHHYLVSGSVDGQILLSDANDASKTQAPGQGKSQNLEDITSLAWNCQVPHILAASSNNGCVVIWDLRHKREVIKLSSTSGGKFSISSLCWNPDNATQIITACEDDSNPVINFWDLRNAHAPEKTLTGHTKGILSVAWCPKDTELLISGAKDNKAICWNPIKGTKISELYHSNNWIFDVQWSPCNPDLFSTASFDGYINVFSFQGVSTHGGVRSQAASNSAFQEAFGIQGKEGSGNNMSGGGIGVDGSNRPSALGAMGGQNAMSMSSTATGGAIGGTGSSNAVLQQHKQPTQIPKWLRPVIGASFGFGGQLIYFNNKNNSKNVTISRIQSSENDMLIKRILELDLALSTGNFQDFCNQRIEKSVTTTLNSSDLENTFWTVARILSGRGENVPQQLLQLVGYDQINLNEQMRNMSISISANKTPVLQESFSNEHLEENGTGNLSLNEDGNDDKEQDENGNGNAKSGSTRPFSLFPKNSSETERSITKSVIKRDFEEAVNICISSGKLSDALLISICGGQELIAKTQQLYLKKANSPYIRIVAGVIKDDMTDVVQNASLENWEQTLALICSFSSLGDKFKSMCNILAGRLETQEGIDVLPAILCYFAARNFEKASSLLVSHLISSKPESMNHFESSSWYCSFVEKLRIAEWICQAPNGSVNIPKVGEIYFEYAQRASSLGCNAIAAKYINSISPQMMMDNSEMSLFAYKLGQLLPSTVKMVEIQRPFEMMIVSGPKSMEKPTPQAIYSQQQQQHQQQQYSHHQQHHQQAFAQNPLMNLPPGTQQQQQQHPHYGMGAPSQMTIPPSGSGPYNQPPLASTAIGTRSQPSKYHPQASYAAGPSTSMMQQQQQHHHQQQQSSPSGTSPLMMAGGGNIQQSAPLYPLANGSAPSMHTSYAYNAPPPSSMPPMASQSHIPPIQSSPSGSGMPYATGGMPSTGSIKPPPPISSSSSSVGGGNIGTGPSMGYELPITSTSPSNLNQSGQAMAPPPPFASGMESGASAPPHPSSMVSHGISGPMPQKIGTGTGAVPPPPSSFSSSNIIPPSAPLMTESSADMGTGPNAKGYSNTLLMNAGGSIPSEGANIGPSSQSSNISAFKGGAGMNMDRYSIPPASGSFDYQPQPLSPTSANPPAMTTSGQQYYGHQQLSSLPSQTQPQMHIPPSSSSLSSTAFHQQKMVNIGSSGGVGGMMSSSSATAPSMPSMVPYSSIPNVVEGASASSGQDFNVPSATATLLQPINPISNAGANATCSLSPKMGGGMGGGAIATNAAGANAISSFSQSSPPGMGNATTNANINASGTGNLVGGGSGTQAFSPTFTSATPFNPSDIPSDLQPIYKSFNDLVTTCQQRAMPMQRRIVDDATKKIIILYQQLIKRELGSAVLELINEMCNGINNHNFDMALRSVHPLMTRHFTEVGPWILAAKRLLEIAKTCLG